MKKNPYFLIYASDLAKYVVAYARERNCDITNLKLQKILYYIEGYFLAEYGYSLYPALIEGWQFGPVLPSVYYEYSIYGADPIILTKKETTEGFNTFNTSITDSEQQRLINKVIRDKMNLDVWELCEATKAEMPWKKATSNGENLGEIITKRSIMLYFRNRRK